MEEEEEEVLGIHRELVLDLNQLRR